MNDYLMIKLKICFFDQYEFHNDRQDKESCYNSFTLKPEKDFKTFFPIGSYVKTTVCPLKAAILEGGQGHWTQF
jgi:hypothetical protein